MNTRTGEVKQVGELSKAFSLDNHIAVTNEMGEAIKPYQESNAKQFVDVKQSLKNYQAIFDVYNEDKILGDKLKQQHKSFLHKLIVLLSNAKSLSINQVEGKYFYVLNVDAKGIASEGNYVGNEPERPIKAHIARLMNLDTCYFRVFQIGDRHNNYRYLIGLSKDLISWK
jgi:hypothetical protein